LAKQGSPWMMLRGVRVVSNRQTAHWAHPPSLVQQVAGAIRGAQIISLYFARPLLRLTTYGLDLILHVSGRWILTVHAQDGELDE